MENKDCIIMNYLISKGYKDFYRTDDFVKNLNNLTFSSVELKPNLILQVLANEDPEGFIVTYIDKESESDSVDLLISRIKSNKENREIKTKVISAKSMTAFILGTISAFCK